MKNCINLRERFGRQYRVAIDTESVEGPRDRDPWLQQIPGRRGVIYPHSATRLAVMVDGHARVSRALAQFCHTAQDGDREKTFLFDPAEFARVARLAKPYRRRRVSEAERRRLASIGFRPRPHTDGA
jgi:hypothetical protein